MTRNIETKKEDKVTSSSKTEINEDTQKSPKVLIVDDEEDFLDIMAQRLSVRGIRVSVTTSAEKVLHMIEKESFDVVIMDCMMPGMEGFRTLKDLKAKVPTLEVILLTAYIPEAQSNEALKLGARAVMEKPADLNSLTQKIFDAKRRAT